MRRCLVLLVGLGVLAVETARAQELTSDLLGVLFDANDPASVRMASYYAHQRRVPPRNLIGLMPVERPVISREELKDLRARALARMPTEVQSLLIIWSRPYAVECMSITTAMAAGYVPSFCEPGCRATQRSPLFDSEEWLPADTVGWLPAMLLPTDDEALAKAVIDRGVASDGRRPSGALYLVQTQDRARNVRAAEYAAAVDSLSHEIRVALLSTPVQAPPRDIMGYFTGAVQVEELGALGFQPGAIADHLTSTAGQLDNRKQMPSTDWLRQGATGTFGSVSEPCNHLGKFPDPAILFKHYLRGETLLEAYWKSVAMPGQGLFVGEPLARPYGAGTRP